MRTVQRKGAPCAPYKCFNTVTMGDIDGGECAVRTYKCFNTVTMGDIDGGE